MGDRTRLPLNFSAEEEKWKETDTYQTHSSDSDDDEYSGGSCRDSSRAENSNSDSCSAISFANQDGNERTRDPEQQIEEEESLVQELCTLDIGSQRPSLNSIRKMKTVKITLQKLACKSILSSTINNKHSRVLLFDDLRNALKRRGSNRNRNKSRNWNRRKVSFAKPKTTSIIESDIPYVWIEDLWYTDEEYESMKQHVMKTFADVIRSNNNANSFVFVESDHQTARGLEATTMAMVVERRQYKIASRFLVFDEQEDQRLSRTKDIEKIRRIYSDATSRSREIARDAAQQDEKEMRLWYEGFSAEDMTNVVRFDNGSW
eukprot:jgi/Psemu1/324339/estExt_fgenesh1_pg.C_1350016